MPLVKYGGFCRKWSCCKAEIAAILTARGGHTDLQMLLFYWNILQRCFFGGFRKGEKIAQNLWILDRFGYNRNTTFIKLLRMLFLEFSKGEIWDY